MLKNETELIKINGFLFHHEKETKNGPEKAQAFSGPFLLKRDEKTVHDLLCKNRINCTEYLH